METNGGVVRPVNRVSHATGQAVEPSILMKAPKRARCPWLPDCAAPSCWLLTLAAVLALAAPLEAQTLFNLSFGVGTASPKTGLAATGMATNDFWNLYRHYEPRYTPGMALVANGRLDKLKLADGSELSVSVAVTNAPGVWGNSSGDPMYDAYIFALNGSNITVTLRGLPRGRYHFYVYGHADPDVTGEQNPVFTLTLGTNTLGPLTQIGGGGWKAGQPWQERAQYVVFRDVPVEGDPVVLEVAPGPNGVAVLNGLQIISRGTSPPRLLAAAPAPAAPVSTNLLFREIRYAGKVSDTEARFSVAFEVESLTTNEISAPLFEGEVALVAPKLPAGLRLINRGRQTRLFCTAPGIHPVELQVLARITRAEPWNQVSFAGPAAAIASVTAKASAEGVEMQLLSGTQLSGPGGGPGILPAGSGPGAGAPGAHAGGTPPLRGFLGADGVLCLRWQSKAAEVTRKSLVTVETAATAQLAPTVIKFTTALKYEILQAALPRVTVELPAAHALTRIQGDQIRDWQIKPDGARQVLTIEFIKPVEKALSITLFSEQTVEATPLAATLVPPQPLEVERESGSFTLSADDTTVAIESAPGLRQVNAPAGALAAYRFNGRPISVRARLERIEPLLKLADRVTARLEETRLVVSHALDLTVEKAGLYALELAPQAGFTVSDVKGDGIEDWKVAAGRVKVSFSARVLGARKLAVQLEQANREFPAAITLLPLGVTGATNITTQLGAASSPGLRLKTGQLDGLREVPITLLPNRSDELLAFASDQPGWKLTLATEKLPARVVAEVFNLATIGDGVVGGSATIRYGIINQGVQEFRLALPPHWKNVEFTGANIRRKEQQTNLWTLTLQDKAWGGYTLVVTYDYQFEPKGATLDLAGAHAMGVERETGSLGIMTAASLKLTPAAPAQPLRRIDETELSESDRALCTRPLLLAYKYTGGDYRHSVQATRFEEVPVLEAAADRIELTTVLTEEGQLLTQSSFMVKNNEKQFQQFKLPAGSEFWSSYVNGLPAKPERNGEWLLVPLPRDANRDQAFAVDIVYAQKHDLKSSLFPRRLTLAAPLTDIPSTYAEWQLFVPVSQRLSAFGGNMTVAQGTTYEFRDAWREFVQFYGDLVDRNIGLLVFCFLAGLVLVLVVAALRRGAKGVVTVIVVFSVLAILAAMMLPALSRAKARAQRVSAVNNLKEIAIAAMTWALDNSNAFPPNYQAMMSELGTEKVTLDPNTGQPFVYIGAGKSSEGSPEAILAYSPSDVGGRAVAFADGSVQVLSAEKFQEALQRDAAVPRAVISANAPPVNAPAAPPVSAFAGAQTAPAQQPAQAQAALSVVGQLRQSTQPQAALPTEGQVEAGGGAQAFARRAGGPGGMIGGSGGAPSPPAQSAAPLSGLRSIRIDVPRTGRAFSFTKVLNAGQQPLTVSVSMMRLEVYRGVQMAVQVCGFVLGLGLLWWLAGRRERSSLRMAVAAALILWSVASLLTMWRLLHIGLIVAVPAVLLAALAWVTWKFRQRRQARRTSGKGLPPPEPPPQTPPGGSGSPVAPAASALALLVLAASPGLAAAQPANPAVLSNTVSILSATYTGSVREKVAQFDATLELSTAATNQLVPLFGEDVALETFAAQGEARLVRDGRMVAVLIVGRTNLTLSFRFAAKLGGDVGRRQLAFNLPPALSSRVSVTLDEAEADVEFPTAVAFERSVSNQQTRVEGVIGAAERLELNWTPRLKRAAEIAATVFAQNTALVTLGGGVMNARATFDYLISQGELKQVRLQLPPGQRLLRVEGEFIRVWEVKDGALIVDLLKGLSPAYKLAVETEKVLDQLPATAKVEIPHALDVKRETGLVALRGGEEISLTVQDARELQRVDAEEFHRAAPEQKDGVISAFRFLKTDFDLSVRAETVQAQLEAVVRHNARLGSDSLRVAAQIDYTIKRAGVFALRLALPQGYRLESVAGANLSQWVERTEQGARLLEVTLKDRTMAAYTLNVVLVQDYKELPKTLPIAGVHPLGAEKISGFITLTTEPGVAAKTESFDGLTEIPFASALGSSGGGAGFPQAGGGAGVSAGQSQGSALGYKFITTTPATEPAWRLSVATETVEPWVRAEIFNTITLTETLVSGRTLVKYDIANAPVKGFRVRVPAAFKNVELAGGLLRRRDQTNDEWRVELQGKVRGNYVLEVTWELPKTEKANVVELTGVQALDVEREAGFIAVRARPPLQAAEQSASELLSRIDPRELPGWAGRIDSATVLAYRYLRPGYKLSLEARRYEEAEVLQALIESARLTTVVADDGQTMTAVSLSIRNHGRQHLEIELPPRTQVWSAFVAGAAVRPSKREGKLLLPLAFEVAPDAPLAVELTYVGLDPFPKGRGTFRLASPRFDLPLKNGHWDLFLPPDYEYGHFAGSMNRTSDTLTPVEQVYSLSEYNVQQQAQEQQQRVEAANDLFAARYGLSSGNLRQTLSSLNRSKAKNQNYQPAPDQDRDLKAVEEELRKAQSSNLLVAQNTYYLANAKSLGDQQALPAGQVSGPGPE